MQSKVQQRASATTPALAILHLNHLTSGIILPYQAFNIVSDLSRPTRRPRRSLQHHKPDIESPPSHIADLESTPAALLI